MNGASVGAAIGEDIPVETRSITVLRQALSVAPSRREVLIGLAGGVLAVGSFGRIGEADAKKGKRKKRKNNKPKTRIGATCPGPSVASGIGLNEGNVRLAQSFTAEASGALERVELEVRKGEGTVGAFLLRLSPVNEDGSPRNRILEETSVDNFTVPEGSSTITFDFADPEVIEAGTRYALVLTRPGGGEFSWGNRSGDGCAGQMFFSPDQTTPFIVPISDFDFVFTAFVRS
jgi:hypothetical protein